MCPRRTRCAFAILLIVITGAAACTAGQTSSDPATASSSVAPQGIFKLDHLIFLVQENRSFDHYFGTYPGANGIPTNADGSFSVCVPDKFEGGQCMKPYVSDAVDQYGGPHRHADAVRDVNGGKMNGFIATMPDRPGRCWVEPTRGNCPMYFGPQHQPDVMSTLPRKAIPNYWSYADNFVLQDAMFAPVDSWTLPSHLFLVSGWSAFCPNPKDPMSCQTDINLGTQGRQWLYGQKPIYAWTDVTWLLDKAGITWRYYVGNDTCWDAHPCHPAKPGRQGYATLMSRNPLPGFTSFWDGERSSGVRNNVVPVNDLRDAAAKGTLPQVAWVGPPSNVSEHPGGPSTPREGMAYVTRLVNAIMSGPDWDTTAIFLTWDDWGGFYDHVVPPRLDSQNFGLRVPGLVISPYAKKGYVDDTALSFDSYLKLIEDRFLGGQRLDPATDGRPDSRPNVPDAHANGVENAFDFTQKPRPPLLMKPWPWKVPEPWPSF